MALEPGGLLAGIAGASTWRVNSLHGQGVAKLAPGVAVEARAEDGTIEAFRVPDAPGFNMAIQWHPEWRFWQDRLSTGIFTAFGAAARLCGRGPARASPSSRRWGEVSSLLKAAIPPSHNVMAGLDPAIHVFGFHRGMKSWMPGPSPGMTVLL